MFVRRSDINSAGKQLLTVNRFLDEFFCLAREQACHLALVPRIKVLDHHDSRKLGLKAGQNRGQRRESAG